MPDEEGLALAEAARVAACSGAGPLLEIGSYCGKATLYLLAGIASAAAHGEGGDGTAAPPANLLVSVDHHRGSEELQAGWPDHDPDVVDPRSGRIDTLPHWRSAPSRKRARRTSSSARRRVVGGRGAGREGLRLVFVDGGHGSDVGLGRLRGWAPHVAGGGLLAIHDVFPDPADGGRPPYELYCRRSAPAPSPRRPGSGAAACGC